METSGKQGLPKIRKDLEINFQCLVAKASGKFHNLLLSESLVMRDLSVLLSEGKDN